MVEVAVDDDDDDDDEEEVRPRLGDDCRYGDLDSVTNEEADRDGTVMSAIAMGVVRVVVLMVVAVAVAFEEKGVTAF